MLDADGVAANLLFERFGREALGVADELITLWRRPSVGHSIDRHGPHIPHGVGETLEERVTTGYVADVAPHVQADGSTVWSRVASPSDRSTRFLSFVDWLEAHDSVYFALQRQFAGVSQHAGPIRGAAAGQVYPKAAGYVRVRLGVILDSQLGVHRHRVRPLRQVALVVPERVRRVEATDGDRLVVRGGRVVKPQHDLHALAQVRHRIRDRHVRLLRPHVVHLRLLEARARRDPARTRPALLVIRAADAATAAVVAQRRLVHARRGFPSVHCTHSPSSRHTGVLE